MEQLHWLERKGKTNKQTNHKCPSVTQMLDQHYQQYGGVVLDCGTETMKLLALGKHCCVQEYSGYLQYDTKGCKGEQVCNGDETMVSFTQGHVPHKKCIA